MWGQQSTITPEDIAKMELVTSALISEDGDKIAYGVAVPVDPTKENAPMNVKLYMMDVASGESTPFITENSIGDLKFRPGHNSMTFTSRRGDYKVNALYEISMNGGEAQKIYEYESSISDYSWHPDGNKIVFVAREKQDDKKSSLPYEPEIYEENLGMSDVFMANVNEDAAKAKNLDLGVHANHAYYSPDGSKIAVSAAPSSLVDDYYTSQRIHILDANGKKVAEVDHTAKLGMFAWSPDGKQIAFIGGEDKHDPTAGRLFVVDATGGKPKILNRDFKGSFDEIAWKDKSNLVFLASEGVYTSMGSINTEGKMKKNLDKVDKSISSFSMSEDGAMALVASTAKYPNELFYMKSARGEPRRMTTTNPWLKDKKMGKQEVVSWTSADGMEIQGILIRPVGAQEGQRYPLITVVHGGPEAHYDNGWLTYYSMPGQMGAGEDFAVFYPNYRGSTGRGIEFAKTSQGDPAGKEFDDVLDGIDHLVEMGLVDENKVGVTGGSYGGYATAWMSTKHSERFAAGVMFVGISNNLSKWGTSDIPEEMFLVHSRKRIWDDYQFFLERSPIYYADQAKTPLLIMHGKEDTRVNPGQSYELYRHIKTRTETPVRLVLYPGEGHGNRKATARYDYSLRMMRWFNTYLKGSGDEEKPPMNLQNVGAGM